MREGSKNFKVNTNTFSFETVEFLFELLINHKSHSDPESDNSIEKLFSFLLASLSLTRRRI